MFSRLTERIRTPIVVLFLFLGSVFVFKADKADAFGIKDLAEVGAAYSTHLFLHELGHRLVADEVGAEAFKMSFMTNQNGRFYAGLSTYKSLPEESKFPYAVGGERMTGFTFEYALHSYRHEPTTFNKALMFFSSVDFVLYTVAANYIYPDAEMYAPNQMRNETGLGKGTLLSLVVARSLINIYRIFNEDANFYPMIELDKDSAVLSLHFGF